MRIIRNVLHLDNPLPAKLWIVPLVLLFTMVAGCGSDSSNPMVAPASQPATAQSTPGDGDAGSGAHFAPGSLLRASSLRPGDNNGISYELFPGLLGTVTRLVTPLLGGTLNLMHSNLSVPPLALIFPTLMNFTMTAAQPAGLPEALPRVYDFRPEGTSFLRSVTLTVSLEDAGTGPISGPIYLYYYNPATASWVRQSDPVTITNQALIVNLHHFSRYAFAR